MLRLNLFRVLLLLTVALVALAPAALAASPPSPIGPASPTMADHVKRGNVARMARRWTDAADAYRAALEAADRERLPRETSAAIAGELGMCELTLGRYRDAAEHLHRALEDPTAGTNEQLGRLRQGYFKAEEQVARLIVAINPSDAELIIDGKPVGRRAPTYVLYVEPGHHLLRARLEGYEDHETALTIPRGGSASTGVKLRAALPTPNKPVTAVALARGGDAVETAATEHDLEQTLGGVSLIPMISFGLTPSASAGGALDVTWRGPRLSIGADFRFLASETTDTVSTVRTVMGRAHVSVCGHRGFFSVCGVGGLGRLHAMKDPTIKQIETEEPWSGSIGIRPAAEWLFSEHLALRGFAEIHAVMGQATVWVDGRKLWTAPPLAGVVGVGMMVPFGHRGSDEKRAARMDAVHRH